MVLADSGRITRVPPYLGTPQEDYGTFRLRGYHPLWPAFPGLFDYIPGGSLDRLFRLAPMTPHNPSGSFLPPVWALPLSLATTRGITNCFLFLRVLRCFTSPGSLPTTMYSSPDTSTFVDVGFPIQRSTDQSLVGGSPWHIAATRVFHRLLKPRHPPYALCSLVIHCSDDTSNWRPNPRRNGT
jgi:hypothetical protein